MLLLLWIVLEPPKNQCSQLWEISILHNMINLYGHILIWKLILAIDFVIKDFS